MVWVRLIQWSAMVDYVPLVCPWQIQNAIVTRCHCYTRILRKYHTSRRERAERRRRRPVSNLVRGIAVAVFRPCHIIGAVALEYLGAFYEAGGRGDVPEGRVRIWERPEADHVLIEKRNIDGAAAEVEVCHTIVVNEDVRIHCGIERQLSKHRGSSFLQSRGVIGHNAPIACLMA